MTRRWPILVLGLCLPAIVGLAMTPARTHLPTPDAALVLVAVVVVVASAGIRLAGYLAAASAGLTFDAALTRPYGNLSIHSGQDVATLVLVLAVGAAVTEIAAQGWRQHARAGAQAGYLDALRRTARPDLPVPELIDRVTALLADVLQLRSCRYHTGPAGSEPRLCADGSVRWGEAVWDVDREGLPLQLETALAAGAVGHFLLSPRLDSRPSRQARLVAVALADNVAAALAFRKPSS